MAWQLDHDIATLKFDSFVGSFDLGKPYLGLSLRGDERYPQIHQLFAFLVPESVAEAYVRGQDLVCKYPPRNSDLVSYHTYYRANDESDGIEFILSAQTSLLDSAPLTQVTSSFGAGDLLWKPVDDECKAIGDDQDFDASNKPCFFLLRPKQASSVSLALFLHPSDFHRARVSGGNDPSVAFWVFPDPLEKGVIRRASLQLRIVPRERDELAAAELLARAANAAPPLTN